MIKSHILCITFIISFSSIGKHLDGFDKLDTTFNKLFFDNFNIVTISYTPKPIRNLSFKNIVSKDTIKYRLKQSISYSIKNPSHEAAFWYNIFHNVKNIYISNNSYYEGINLCAGQIDSIQIMVNDYNSINHIFVFTFCNKSNFNFAEISKNDKIMLIEFDEKTNDDLIDYFNSVYKAGFVYPFESCE